MEILFIPDRFRKPVRYEKIAMKAGKRIAKMPEPFAPENLQHASKKLCKGKKNNPKITLNFRVRFCDYFEINLRYRARMNC